MEGAVTSFILLFASPLRPCPSGYLQVLPQRFISEAGYFRDSCVWLLHVLFHIVLFYTPTFSSISLYFFSIVSPPRLISALRYFYRSETLVLPLIYFLPYSFVIYIYFSFC